jgi:5-formyltetrahydrofolate cyclo-ligase
MDFESEIAAAEKTKIRLDMREIRDAIDPELLRKKNDDICRALLSLPEYKAADNIMAYIAFGTEANPETAMHAAAAERRRIMVPDHFGLIEVTGVFAKRAKAEDIDLVLVPGLAFDENGYRLGYGGGWYDRFTTKLRNGVKLAGLAYEEQVVRSLPAEPHDLRLDMIITDRRIIRPV